MKNAHSNFYVIKTIYKSQLSQLNIEQFINLRADLYGI